jgi:hypothetical protein
MFAQAKRKVIFIAVDNTKDAHIQNKKDSIYTWYNVLEDRAYELINGRKSSEVLKTISNEEFKKIQSQIFYKKSLTKMSDEQLEKILFENEIYIIDLTNKKRIKKIPVKVNQLVFMP